MVHRVDPLRPRTVSVLVMLFLARLLAPLFLGGLPWTSLDLGLAPAAVARATAGPLPFTFMFPLPLLRSSVERRGQRADPGTDTFCAQTTTKHTILSNVYSSGYMCAARVYFVCGICIPCKICVNRVPHVCIL